MKKPILIILILIWISSLLTLIIALTDLIPNNPLQEFRLIVGLGFITLSGLIRIAWRKLLKTK